MRLVAVARIEALFLDQVSAWLYPVTGDQRMPAAGHRAQAGVGFSGHA